MKTYKILIFPCGTEIANEIISALKNHKYFKPVLASSEFDTYCHFLNRNIHYLPFITDEKFEATLQKLIAEKNIDFIIPAHDDVAYGLSRLEGNIGSKVVGQSKKVNELVRFKDKTYEYFQNILPIAKIYKDISKIDFPIFVKPIKGQGSQNSFALYNTKQLQEFQNNYESEKFIYMEQLTGEEYTIDCFSDKGKLLYAGARTRDKTNRGISVISRHVKDEITNKKLHKYAQTISSSLKMHGLWFFQMKKDKNGELKLLEVGPRVSGTMMLNRTRGVNFIELALYQKLGFNVEVVFNDIDISLGRALAPKYKTNIEYGNLYIDFDDTLFLDEKYINTDLMKLIFQAKNEGKNVYLITKNKKNNLTKALHTFGISHIFDDILHIKDTDKKVNYIKKNSVLIDDSFQERKEAIGSGIYAFANDAIDLLIR